MTRIFLALILLTASYLWSCSCKTEIQGVVLDAQTLQPIEGVSIQIHLASVHEDTLAQPTSTNAQGQYQAVHFYCSNYLFDFDKEGYMGFTASKESGDTILLTREGLE